MYDICPILIKTKRKYYSFIECSIYSVSDQKDKSVFCCSQYHFQAILVESSTRAQDLCKTLVDQLNLVSGQVSKPAPHFMNMNYCVAGLQPLCEDGGQDLQHPGE